MRALRRRLTRALLGTAILTAVALAPSVAAPGAEAHSTGYCGYGSSGWSGGWLWWAEDRYAGQQSGSYLLILHDYSGIAAPSDFYAWCHL